MRPQTARPLGIWLMVMIGFAQTGVGLCAQVILQWDPVAGPDIAGYRLFVRRTGQPCEDAHHVRRGALPSCLIQLSANTQQYDMVVKAFDRTGNESGDSNEVIFQAASRGLSLL